MIYTKPVFIADARRTPIGRLGGVLKNVGAADLALTVARAIVPATAQVAVDQVILGQVLAAGSGMNTARQVGLRLGLPQATPAMTINMVCASGLKALAIAADSIAAGEASLVLAGGVESMSRLPYYAPDARWGRKFGDAKLVDPILGDGLTDAVLGIPMGETAERIAEQLGISRGDQDRFAAESQRRVAAAQAAWRREIVSVETREGAVATDEHPRADTTLAKLAELKPSFRPAGTVTAGNASGLNDGAALALVGDETALRRHGLAARARIVAATAVGCDPATMGLGPVGAIRRLCAETGWDLSVVDAIEINEAFAAQVLGCARQLEIDPEKLNRRGGAIALGHPLGCSGARVVVTLLHLMEDLNLWRGIASLCVGGGMGIAMAIER